MKHRKVDRLIYLFSKLPGIGSRTAKRVVLHLIKHKDRLMAPIGEALLDASSSIRPCKICHNLDETEICYICLDINRDKGIICVVESVIDLWALENAAFYKGVYHVLGGALSGSTNTFPQDLTLEKLYSRITNDAITEVIIATNATLEGQNTAFFLSEKLKNRNVKITRFANGIPIGGELDYLDEGTISAAFNCRASMENS